MSLKFISIELDPDRSVSKKFGALRRDTDKRLTLRDAAPRTEESYVYVSKNN